MPEIIKITSRDNRRLTAIRKVRDGQTADRIFIEGTRLVKEALRSGLEFEESVVSTSFLEGPHGSNIVGDLIALNIPLIETPDRLFSSLVDTVNSQGVILVAKRPKSGLDTLKAEAARNGASLFVLLHETNDPSNLGAVMRTAEAAGVVGVLVTKGSADAFSPKALRASMGSSFRIPIWDRLPLMDAAEWARENSIRVVAADISGERSYSELDWSKSSLVVFGSEANGLSENDLSVADVVVTIPMQNGVESLNLAVTTGIILFEARRQTLTRPTG